MISCFVFRFRNRNLKSLFKIQAESQLKCMIIKFRSQIFNKRFSFAIWIVELFSLQQTNNTILGRQIRRVDFFCFLDFLFGFFSRRRRRTIVVRPLKLSLRGKSKLDHLPTFYGSGVKAGRHAITFIGTKKTVPTQKYLFLSQDINSVFNILDI
jgi:hypothetical protein